jgi:hypothetical protein
LVALALGRLADGSRKAEVYLRTKNLQGQLQKERDEWNAPGQNDGPAQWIPGYSIYRTARDWRDGLYVSGEDLLWAGLDAADVIVTVGSLGGSAVVTQGGKVVVKQGGKAALKGGGKTIGRRAVTVVGTKAVQQGEKQAAQRLLARARKQAESSYRKWLTGAVRRYARELPQKLTAEAEDAIRNRLEARLEGLILAGLDKGEEHRRLQIAGDSNGLEDLSEELGKAAVLAYARSVGYALFHENRQTAEERRKRRGGKTNRLETVHKDGKRIKVILPHGAKRPDSGKSKAEQIKNLLDLVRGMAERGKESDVPAERVAAREVLRATQEKRLDVEVLHVEQSGGKVHRVRVEMEAGDDAKRLRDLATAATGILREMPGARTAWIRELPDRPPVRRVEEVLAVLRPLCRRLHLHTWEVGGHPLVLRRAMLAPETAFLSPGQLDLVKEVQGVGELSITFMEWIGAGAPGRSR